MSQPASAETFLLEGILVASDPGRVRLVLDQIALDIDELDVLNVSALPAPPLLVQRVATVVRLELRRPTRLLHVGDASAYEDVIWRRGQLFSLRTRRNSPADPVGHAFMAQEREFLARYGLADSRSDETP